MYLTVKIKNKIYYLEGAEIDAFINKVKLGQIELGFSIITLGTKG